MSRLEAPPFPRGETFYNGGTIDSNNLGGTQMEGVEWEFDDIQINASGGAKPQRTNRKVRCRCVRNVGAVAILPKRLVRFQKTAGVYGARVDGYTATTAERGYPVDEYLPAAGCPVNDLCWIVVQGPALCLTDLAGADNDVITVGDVMIALTGATSGATTSGRIYSQVISAASTSLDTLIYNAAENYVGRALSAKTTANTNADVLVEVGKW